MNNNQGNEEARRRKAKERAKKLMEEIFLNPEAEDLSDVTVVGGPENLDIPDEENRDDGNVEGADNK